MPAATETSKTVMEAITAIRLAGIPCVPENARARVCEMLSRYVDMMPVGEAMGAWHFHCLSAMVMWSYAVGRLDGVREMVGDFDNVDRNGKG